MCSKKCGDNDTSVATFVAILVFMLDTADIGEQILRHQIYTDLFGVRRRAVVPKLLQCAEHFKNFIGQRSTKKQFVYCISRGPRSRLLESLAQSVEHQSWEYFRLRILHQVQCKYRRPSFWYSRAKKPQITRDNGCFQPILNSFRLKQMFSYSQLKIFSGTRIARETCMLKKQIQGARTLAHVKAVLINVD